jgi:hypothetical protein
MASIIITFDVITVKLNKSSLVSLEVINRDVGHVLCWLKFDESLVIIGS